ncbi:MAG TPA: thioesterase family protein, partial [Chloroflexota bacterium]
IAIEPRFADCDMFNHVNNAKYLTYIESARIAYYSQVSGISNPCDFDMTLASVKIDYIKPVFFGGTLHVYSRADRVGTKSWTLEHELRDAATGELAAFAHTVIVHYDHDSGKSKPLPEDIVRKLEEFEGRKLRAS